MQSRSGEDVRPPPQTVGGILRQLGPGLIIAGSIVGSGELIATTKTGAQAGFWLLWLIIVGCVIKVFAQVEFGRYAICCGKGTMAALDEVPGPRLSATWLSPARLLRLVQRGKQPQPLPRVNWVLWYWLVMFVVSLGQLGGIVGGVGQSLAMSYEITGDFNRLLAAQDAWDREAKPLRDNLFEDHREQLAHADLAVRRATLKRIDQRIAERLGRPRPDYKTRDDLYWATMVTAITVVVLMCGRYRLVQNVSTVLVAAFTAITVFNVLALQSHAEWAVGLGDLGDGLGFRLPPVVAGLTKSPLTTALATFGIIGVGANELIQYPYWCLEKGYARFAGPPNPSVQWGRRANGWLRVMRWDAMASMVIYTFATVAFYLLGAAVLHRAGLDPEGNQMIRVLAEMYVPVFGQWARLLFLFGAFAVLYSTFFVANAGHARVAADALGVFGIGASNPAAQRRWVVVFSGLFPVLSLLGFVLIRAPARLVLASGVMQAIMLPMLGGATLYFRYRRCDARVRPGRLWDVMLWLSVLGLLVAGGWLALTKLFPALERLV